METGTQDRTLTNYDGGVRQSMFLFQSLEALTQAETKLAREAGASAASPSPQQIFMIRNGPTVAKVDEKANGKRGAIPTAQRGYSLVANQSEVTAIEAIRLRDDTAEMRVATADGHDRGFTDPASPTGVPPCLHERGRRSHVRARLHGLPASLRAFQGQERLWQAGRLASANPAIAAGPFRR